MMPLATSIGVYLANGTDPYSPGTVLSGQFQIVTNQPEGMILVKVSCVGLFLQSISSMTSIKTLVSTPMNSQSGEVIFSKVELIQLYLHDNPWCHFNFDLPPDLPSSFTSRRSIRYFVVVQMENSVEMEICPFSVERQVDLNENELAWIPGHFIDHSFVDWLKICLLLSDYVSLEVSIPRRGFIPLERIPLKVSVINQSSHVAKVKACITQDLVYSKTHLMLDGKAKEKSTVQVEEGPSVKSQCAIDWEGEIEIPVKVLTSSVNSNFVQIRHQLQIDVSIARCCKRGWKKLVRGCLPIIIGDIPRRTYPPTPNSEVFSDEREMFDCLPPKYANAIQGLPTYEEARGNE